MGAVADKLAFAQDFSHIITRIRELYRAAGSAEEFRAIAEGPESAYVTRFWRDTMSETGNRLGQTIHHIAGPWNMAGNVVKALRASVIAQIPQGGEIVAEVLGLVR